MKTTIYESINDFLSFISTTPTSEIMKGCDSSTSGTRSFTGTSSYEEAMGLLKNGWLSGAEKLADPVKLSQKSAQTVKRSTQQFGVVGQQAIVPLYLQGAPNSMMSRVNKPVKQKIITINRGITYNAMVTTETILEEGRKTIQIIQSLENAGLRVKLNVIFAADSGREKVCVKVCVKQPQERLNISKLSFTLGHPSMLRRIMFRWLETTPTITTTGFRGGYGRPCGAEASRQFEKEYYLPERIHNVEEFVKKILK